MWRIRAKIDTGHKMSVRLHLEFRIFAISIIHELKTLLGN